MTVTKTSSLKKLFIESEYKNILKEKKNYINRKEMPISFRFSKMKRNFQTPISKNFHFKKNFCLKKKKKNYFPKNNFYKKNFPFIIITKTKLNLLKSEIGKKKENRYNIFFEDFGKNLKSKNFLENSNINFQKYDVKNNIDFAKTSATFY